MTFGQSIRWTEWGGGNTTVTVSGCESIEKARMEAIKSARQAGWTYPRCWEFWRWNDTRPLDSAADGRAEHE